MGTTHITYPFKEYDTWVLYGLNPQFVAITGAKRDCRLYIGSLQKGASASGYWAFSEGLPPPLLLYRSFSILYRLVAPGTPAAASDWYCS
jgi:hypothetical protein